MAPLTQFLSEIGGAAILTMKEESISTNEVSGNSVTGGSGVATFDMKLLVETPPSSWEPTCFGGCIYELFCLL